ncbi:hypothetical protein M153_2810003241 [Pseudoloma neurophilia]|uniref:Uncharacterized protein n=1 Tax=Pseudoloma neurophilia TaxID=146866 RepID=A0A0R0LYI2_9MICR|nr:hypothetical protein M153_2810003241 [Pseudoloma neurophilia]
MFLQFITFIFFNSVLAIIVRVKEEYKLEKKESTSPLVNGLPGVVVFQTESITESNEDDSHVNYSKTNYTIYECYDSINDKTFLKTIKEISSGECEETNFERKIFENIWHEDGKKDYTSRFINCRGSSIQFFKNFNKSPSEIRLLTRVDNQNSKVSKRLPMTLPIDERDF